MSAALSAQQPVPPPPPISPDTIRMLAAFTVVTLAFVWPVDARFVVNVDMLAAFAVMTLAFV
jgi:hypothetical protein